LSVRPSATPSVAEDLDVEWPRRLAAGPREVRATVLALLLCAACGHVSNNAAGAATIVAIAAAVQLLAPPALEGRTGICPESREIRCVTTALCAHDLRRGCDSCRCAAFLNGSMVIAPGGAATSGNVNIHLELQPPPWVPP
jgi:hypothetical protein